MPLLRCAQHSRDRHFSDVSGSTTEERTLIKTNQTHLAFWKIEIVSHYLLFPLFAFLFLWVHEVGLQMRSSAGSDAA